MFQANAAVDALTPGRRAFPGPGEAYAEQQGDR